VIVVPEAPNSASSPLDARAPSRTETVDPVASFICDAIVRFQIRS
jgi:hypothetical protein